MDCNRLETMAMQQADLTVFEASTPPMCPEAVYPEGAFGERVACVASFTLPTSVWSNALDSIGKDPSAPKSTECCQGSTRESASHCVPDVDCQAAPPPPTAATTPLAGVSAADEPSRRI
jgi:hypothetical protein